MGRDPTARHAQGRERRSAERSYARGYPQQPATWSDLGEKFAECADGALSPARVVEVTGMVRELDRVPDTGELMAALAGSA